MIPYGKQSISEDDIEAVISALKSDFLTCGPLIDEFEKQFAEHVGASYAVCCSNGTAALHLAMLAAGIGSGDRVVTTPITFLASANAAAYVGAEVQFCDIEPVAASLDAEVLEKEWHEDTKAVVGVDYAGHPADFEAISKVAHSRGAIVIEDACHSNGGSIVVNGEHKMVGSLPGVDMTTYSFHPIKTMTTGEGGMLVTNNKEYADRARMLRTHGMERDTERFKSFGSPPLEEIGPWSYEMSDLGYNYRLTDFQCALGISQLKRLDSFVERRLEIVERYHQNLSDCDTLKLPSTASWVGEGSRIGWHLFTVRIDFEALGKTRLEVGDELRAMGVGTQVLYIPVSLQPYYLENSAEGGPIPQALDFYHEAISLPLFPALTDADVDHICDSVKKVLVARS